MDRVTDKLLVAKVARMQAADMDVGLDGQYGRFAVTNKEGSRKLSDRTTNSHIMQWLDAFEQGHRAGLRYAILSATAVRSVGAIQNG